MYPVDGSYDLTIRYGRDVMSQTYMKALSYDRSLKVVGISPSHLVVNTKAKIYFKLSME